VIKNITAHIGNIGNLLQVKVSLCMTKRHRGNWWYSFRHSLPQH